MPLDSLPLESPRLESRVIRLERELRFHRLLTVLTLLGLVAVTALGAAGGIPEVIRAGRFEVVDDSGRPLVTLKATSWGGQVQTLGRDGVSGVSMGATSTGGFVGVRDRKPTLFPRVELSTDDSGGVLTVRNWNGFAVHVDRDGLAVAHTQERTGFMRIDPRVVLGVNENGGHVRVLSATGTEAVSLHADDNGTGILSAYASNGDQRVVRP